MASARDIKTPTKNNMPPPTSSEMQATPRIKNKTRMHAEIDIDGDNASCPVEIPPIPNEVRTPNKEDDNTSLENDNDDDSLLEMLQSPSRAFPNSIHENLNHDLSNAYHTQGSSKSVNNKIPPHLYILPVLFLEFMAISLTRAILPSLILAEFDSNVYIIMGCAECMRGLLAFISCPLFGKISDSTGRRPCLFVTVLGTCAPVCSLAILSVDWSGGNFVHWMQENKIYVFVYLLALSGLFSSTFTLTFAYISDVVPKQAERVGAYGLALATFGLSFTIGPMAGGYLARVENVGIDDINDDLVDGHQTTVTLDGEMYNNGEFEQENLDVTLESNLYPRVHLVGQRRVFMCSLILVILDLLYIWFVLPESRVSERQKRKRRKSNEGAFTGDAEDFDRDGNSVGSATMSLQERMDAWKAEYIPQSWTPLDALRVFSGDPLLAEVGRIAFLYYTSLWAVISTFVIYAAKRFHFGPERLGELMSAFGLSTMLAEAVLLRIVVPVMGEKRVMKLGLAAFTCQCVVLGLAFEGWQMFICVGLSMLSNLVYPSLTSLVSNVVAADAVGEALGAVNGVKALTEGIGPLFFGGLMTISEKSVLPGWPYLLASAFAILAYQRANHLPDDQYGYDDKYINEKYSGAASKKQREGRMHGIMGWLGAGEESSINKRYGYRNGGKNNSPKVQSIIFGEDDEEEEICGLLSAFEKDDEGKMETIGEVEMKEDTSTRIRNNMEANSKGEEEEDLNDDNPNTKKLQGMSFFSANL
eukprot:CAMPEP_0195536126 /NCGR_PEP_ID=MMETSP0794_2-20130614/45497_1 /TAXON_ID=515487 /ORGANISM="Stephanopyxis turris, Strain CCMP 815" /LENGTH=756 /DNA_ID=CAMNT_0040669443 /DNA_START=126 /DNA_END=2396 /DNA_ORIENTATION=-